MKKILFIVLVIIFISSCHQKNTIVNNYAQIEFEKNLKTLEINSGSNAISSGVFLDGKTILTTAHGIGTSKDKYIINTNKEAYLYKKDSSKDIAMIKLKEYEDKNTINIGNEAEKGDIIFILKSEGFIKTEIFSKNKNNYISKLEFTPGDSGSGVFDKNFHLIGIVGAYDRKNNQGIIYKITAKDLRP